MGVLFGLGVLLDDANALLEKVRVDSNAVFLWDKHDDRYRQKVMLVVFIARVRKHEKRTIQ